MLQNWVIPCDRFSDYGLQTVRYCTATQWKKEQEEVDEREPSLSPTALIYVLFDKVVLSLVAITTVLRQTHPFCDPQSLQYRPSILLVSVVSTQFSICLVAIQESLNRANYILFLSHITNSNNNYSIAVPVFADKIQSQY